MGGIFFYWMRATVMENGFTPAATGAPRLVSAPVVALAEYAEMLPEPKFAT